MSYFGFLVIFLGAPLGALIWLARRDAQQGVTLPVALSNWSFPVVLAAHVVIAVVYTTPWDNYLVATRVWWYDPALVSGVILGWVPLEEYIFFVAQTLLTGLWLVYLARRLPEPGPETTAVPIRRLATGLVFLVWAASIAILAAGWQPGTYLGLELSWGLAPVLLQVAFGADILWRYRRLVGLSIIPTTLYLSAADALAISSGTWTINPDLSLGIYLGGVLPLEEFIFFALTNTLVSLGVVLVLARQSQERLQVMLENRPLWLRVAGRRQS